MKCDQVKLELSMLLPGEAGPPGCNDHLRLCPDCRSFAVKTNRQTVMLRSLIYPATPSWELRPDFPMTWIGSQAAKQSIGFPSKRERAQQKAILSLALSACLLVGTLGWLATHRLGQETMVGKLDHPPGTGVGSPMFPPGLRSQQGLETQAPTDSKQPRFTGRAGRSGENLEWKPSQGPPGPNPSGEQSPWHKAKIGMDLGKPSGGTSSPSLETEIRFVDRLLQNNLVDLERKLVSLPQGGVAATGGSDPSGKAKSSEFAPGTDSSWDSLVGHQEEIATQRIPRLRDGMLSEVWVRAKRPLLETLQGQNRELKRWIGKYPQEKTNLLRFLDQIERAQMELEKDPVTPGGGGSGQNPEKGGNLPSGVNETVPPGVPS